MTVWSFNKITGISYLATRLIEMSYIFFSTAKDFWLTRTILPINIFLHENHIEVVILSLKLCDIQNWKRNSGFLQRFFIFYYNTCFHEQIFY